MPDEEVNIMIELHRKYAKMLDGLKISYKKVVMDDENITWDELKDMLENILINVMGKTKFKEWREKIDYK